MKILVLSPSFYLPDQDVRIGGGEISNFLLLEYLARKGHEIHVIAIHGILSDNLTVHGIHVHNISAKTSMTSCRRLIATLYYKNQALKIASNLKPNVILSITSATPVGLELKKKLNIPLGVILRAENDLIKWRENTSYFKYAFQKIALGDCSNSLLETTDFMIVNSEYMQRQFKKVSKTTNSDVIYPPVEDKQRTFRVPDGIRHIVSVGTSKRKGFGTIQSLAKKMPEIQFHVVGDYATPSGKYKKDGNLKISGWIDQKSEYLEETDLVLVPSTWNEPFGRIAVEALRYGRCVLVSDKGGLPEVVNHEEKLIVSCDDTLKWHERIQKMNQDMTPFINICQKVAEQTSRFMLAEQAERMERVLLRYC